MPKSIIKQSDVIGESSRAYLQVADSCKVELVGIYHCCSKNVYPLTAPL